MWRERVALVGATCGDTKAGMHGVVSSPEEEEEEEEQIYSVLSCQWVPRGGVFFNLN